MKPFSLKTSSLFFGVCLFVVASATRLFSLGAHWTSDERGWLDHSTVFMTAVEMGAFSETLVTFHPGVITIWIAALRTFFTEPHISVQGLALARWFIGVALLIGIGVAAVLLYRLFGRWIALIGAAFLSFSPLFLAQSRRVHTDALASIFVLLTVLSLLLYCQIPSKTPLPNRFWNCLWSSLPCQKQLAYSSLVAPYLLRPVSESGGNVAAVLSPGAWSGTLFPELHVTHRFRAVAPLLEPHLFDIWVMSFRRHTVYVSGVTESGTSTTHPIFGIGCGGRCGVRLCRSEPYGRVFDGVAWAITTPHNVEHFFLGQVLYDPGWLFYPLVLCINTTPLTLPLAFGACLFLWRKRHQEGYARQFRIALGLVAVVLLFTLCLSLTSKKFSRYLLPAFPMLEILAAVGFFEFLKWGYSYIDSRFGTGANSPKTYLFYRDLPLSLPDPNRASPTASPLLRHLLQPLLQTH